MTLNEAYNEAYSLRNTKLKGRFKYNFSMWRNGKGPSEKTQRTDLLRMGFMHCPTSGWSRPKEMQNLALTTVVVTRDRYIDVIDASLDCNELVIDFGDIFKIHLAGPKKTIRKIEKKFGKPNKNK